MPNYRTNDPEDVLECPYEKAHMIRAKRYPYHLMKCRRNYTGKDFAVCPFNARHEMPKPELKYHMANCPDKAFIEADLAHTARKHDSNSGTYFKGNTDVPVYDTDWTHPEPTEDWDAEALPVPRIGVDPKVINDPNKFRDLSGLRPSEKKEYKKRLVQITDRRKQGLPYDDLLEDMTGREAAMIKRQQLEAGIVEEEAPAQTQLRQPKQKPRVVQQQEMIQNKMMMSAGIGRGRPAVQPPAQKAAQPQAAQMNGTMLKINQDAQILAQLARGRGMPLGRGQGLPTVGVGRGALLPPGQYPVITVNQVSHAATNAPGRLNDAYDDSSTGSEEEITQNKTRKLQKKLREIDIILRKRQRGETLNPDQEEKVSCRSDIIADLERLELE